VIAGPASLKRLNRAARLWLGEFLKAELAGTPWERWSGAQDTPRIFQRVRNCGLLVNGRCS